MAKVLAVKATTDRSEHRGGQLDRTRRHHPRWLTLMVVIGLLAQLIIPVLLSTQVAMAQDAPRDAQATEVAPAPTQAPVVEPTATLQPVVEPTATLQPVVEPTATLQPVVEPTATPAKVNTGPLTIKSDKDDYPPGGYVTLTGGGWQPGELVHIYVNDDQGMTWTHNVDVVADANGAIVYGFNLPNWFVATYQVVAKGPISGTTSTAFTDGNVKFNVAPTGQSANFIETMFSGTSCSGTPTSSQTHSNTKGQTIGVGDASSLRLDAAATSSGGFSFSAWSGAADSPFTVIAGTNRRSICIAGFKEGTKNYVATYVANTAPVVTNQSVTTNEDTAQAITLSGTDADGNALTYSIVSGPSNGTLGTVSGSSVTYSPSPNFNGSDSFTYKANDGKADSNTATVSLTVTAVNDAPSFTKGVDQTVAEDAAAVTVMGWATGISAGPANENGQTLDFLVTNDNSALFSAQPAISASGTLTFTPAANANGSATVTVRLHDDGGTANGGVDTSAEKTFTITVTAVNDAPIAVNDAATVAEDQSVLVAVLVNDSAGPANESGQTLTVTAVGTAAHGTATLVMTGADAGKIRYTAAANYFGTDSFTYAISDGNGGSATATVTITVTAVNDAPVAGSAEVTDPAYRNTTISATYAGFSDPDDDTLSYTYQWSRNGTAVAGQDGATYTGTQNRGDTIAVVVTASDGALTATASDSVTLGNRAPVANAQSVATNEDTAKAITLSGTDPDGDGLSYTVTSGPSHGTLSGMGANRTYTPAQDYNGTDSFTFTVYDGVATSNEATVTITVSEVNDAPVAVNDAKTVAEDGSISFPAADLVANDSAGPANESGQTLTVTAVGTAAHGTVTLSNGTVTYAPAANYNGADSFTYTETDNGTTNGAADPKSHTATVNVTVIPVNDVPTVQVTSFTVDSLTRVANTAATYADPDTGDTHTVVFTYKDGNTVVLTTTSRSASGGTVTDQSVLPARCYTNLTVTVTVTDNAGLVGSATRATSTTTTDVYNASFQAPIKDGERNLAKAGNVVPVKVVLTSSCTGAAVTTETLYVQVVKGASPSDTAYGEEVITTSVSAADSGTQMRVSGSGYMYNLSTRGLTTGQDYTIQIRNSAGQVILTAVIRTTK